MKNETTPAYSKSIGHLRLTVWENEGKGGAVWFNTQIVRRFKDGDVWKDSTHFSGIGDLALLGEAVELAKRFIAGRENALATTEEPEQY